MTAADFPFDFRCCCSKYSERKYVITRPVVYVQETLAIDHFWELLGIMLLHFVALDFAEFKRKSSVFEMKIDGQFPFNAVIW